MTPRAPPALLTVVLAALVPFTGGTASAAPAVEYPTWPTPPFGANDWDCRPTAERPHPAVIVHGTFRDARSLLDNLSLALKQDGYCVYSLDYGNRATGPIEESAQQLDVSCDQQAADSAFLTPDGQSTNITLQDRCPAEHPTIVVDPQAIAWVLHAFDREGPADAAAPIGCTG